MKKSMKFISLLLAVLLLIGATVMIVSAEGEEGGGETPIDTPVDPDPGPVDPDPGPVDPDPGPVDPDPGPVDPDPGPVDPDPIIDGGGTGTGTGDGEYTGGDNTGGYTPIYNDDPIFFGDAAQYDYNTGSGNVAAGSVTQQTQQYQTSGMSDAEVAPNEWTMITLDEKTTTTNSGNVSFASIKNNTGTEDNGQWIMFAGYALIALAVLGILYFIIATVSARTAYKRTLTAQTAQSYSTDIPERSERSSRVRKAVPAHAAQPYNGASRRKVSAKADTGEVYIPRRSRAK